ncbi:hypothetical protein FFWV33_07715 [Flavobacterium faecale]|uniref:Fucosyltransferase C-terminal domain-containing protein n=1 Tax=Flavobacterium faecale TaxID=1355330 RepID=A0A2S1LCE7_9FLAO|nr:glycosyltransferase family 10 [Flavobacterium faecale]AWG21425.1 hypothetical protein FFWV33_07715 [Flavobacterium faecale]
MKIAFWSFYEQNCLGMEMFLNPDSVVANGIFKKWNTLYSECINNDIEIISLDKVTDFEEISFVVFSDFPIISNPIVKNVFESAIPKILIIEEGPLIHPDNWKLSNHKLFNYIFTWNDDYVDNKKYFKFNVHYIDNVSTNIDLINKKKLLVMVARNKRAIGKNELYSERRKVIRFFEKLHPQDFDLFGQGWDIYYFPSNFPILRLFNGRKLYWFRSKIKEYYSSWKGEVDDKKDLMSKYKFSVCFENAIGPTGYISEKIWDGFASGTVPIYFGAPNVTEHIPENCFIDYRNYKTLDDLYYYIKSINEREYKIYLDNINKFLKKEKSHQGQFTDLFFVNSFIKLLKDNTNKEP